MKKPLLYFSVSFFSVCATAQVTITSADGPQLNQTFITGSDTLSTTGPGSNGPSMTWNFGSLIAHDYDTMTVIPVSGTPAAATFSASTACFTTNAGSLYAYITNNSTGLRIDGFYSNDSLFGITTVKYSSPSYLIKYPATYMSTYTNTAKYDARFAFSSPPVDSIRNITTIKQTSTVNAWGTLTTPAGTYNCIRQDWKDVQTDSGYYHVTGGGNNWVYTQATTDSTKGSRWWTNGKGFSVMEMDQNAGTNAVERTTYLISSAVGIEESAAGNVFVLCYPNPANGEINFMTKENTAGSITITDSRGRQIEKIAVDGKQKSIETSMWPAGIYYYTLQSERANPLTGKIIVTH